MRVGVLEKKTHGQKFTHDAHAVILRSWRHAWIKGYGGIMGSVIFYFMAFPNRKAEEDQPSPLESESGYPTRSNQWAETDQLADRVDSFGYTGAPIVIGHHLAFSIYSRIQSRIQSRAYFHLQPTLRHLIKERNNG
jgi:hypothetical protein